MVLGWWSGYVPLDDRRAIDFGSDGRPRGIELLSGADVHGLPEEAEVAALLAEYGIAFAGAPVDAAADGRRGKPAPLTMGALGQPERMLQDDKQRTT
jgi:hypothetical protein